FTLTMLTIAFSVLDRLHNKFTDPQIKLLFDIAFAKIDLGPGRIILFFMWFVCLYHIFQRLQKPITKYLGWLFLTFGQNSLLTYSVQSVFLFVQYYIPFKY